MVFGAWLACLLVAVPVLLLAFLIWNRDKLEARWFKQKHGGLYEGVNLTSTWQLAYSSLYIFRRLGLTYLIACVDDPSLQIGLFILMQALQLCYIVAVNPCSDLTVHTQELQNEGLTMLCLYVMMGMTD